MDGLKWIHADSGLQELREITDINEADMEIDISGDAQLIDNTWSMTVTEKVWEESPIREGHYIYAPKTEWGGPVTLIKHVTGSKLVTIQGPTWRGLLHQRRIYPPAGQGYRIYTNIDANDLIGAVIGQSFGSIFIFSGEECGVDVSAQYRYQTYATGLQAVLADAGLRLNIVFYNTTPAALLSAEPVDTLTDEIEISQDYGINFTSEIGNVELANHCLALGQGELAERMVLNVYRVGDKYYTSQPASLSSADIRTVLLDYSSAESESELLKSAVERLQATGPKQSITINQARLNVDAHLGDRLNVRDRLTGLVAESEVSKKILTIKDGRTAIDMQIEILTIQEGA